MPITTCVLIPSYNEARTIGAIVRELKTRQLTVYVVEDGSTDDTASIAKSESAAVVVHSRNKGKGASLIEGFRHILKKEFESVLVMDGDGQHSVGDVDSFLKKMEETNADMVIGNRMSDTCSMPYVRIQTNHFMSWLISMMSGQTIPDSQCGFRLIKRKVLQDVKLGSMHYDTESELIIKAARRGFKIESIPIKTVYQDERSRINPIVDTLRFVMLIVRIFFNR